MRLKNRIFDHETRKSGLFPCYRLKINDFLSSYNPNLKINIFTPLQQISCYCKSRLGTLRLIPWWRVTYIHINSPTDQFSHSSGTILLSEVHASRERHCQVEIMELTPPKVEFTERCHHLHQPVNGSPGLTLIKSRAAEGSTLLIVSLQPQVSRAKGVSLGNSL